MLTKNFNQDPLENFFGNIRSYGSRNIAPNTMDFEGAFKALLISNYNDPHSKNANCAEDLNVCLQTLDFYLEEKVNDTVVPEDNVIHINSDILSFDEPQNNDAGQSNYVCGWVLKKTLTNVIKGCQICKKTLLEKELN
ncbi:hypothetical protein O3G_MSEX003213 [Manduca sexta]|uniref:Transposable element P transposase-like RNase H C-terminal domain-containing protein n=1 Tax=Manduca sexta TaxID=7130 RepID=A0A922CEN5_MANSE|nr:hypothetical protein O3G_MSEX003213 [Manduca sexta]